MLSETKCNYIIGTFNEVHFDSGGSQCSKHLVEGSVEIVHGTDGKMKNKFARQEIHGCMVCGN